jgi:predicted TPR repeat methyltransferase
MGLDSVRLSSLAASAEFFLDAPSLKIQTLMIANVSILAEIPEELHETLKSYLESHPDWDQDRVFSAALSLFLMQNGDCDRRAARVYLDTLFNRAVR